MGIVQDYITQGWSIVAIPPGVKGPIHAGWNLKHSALANEEVLPPGYGVGLLHAYSSTMALDVDDWERTRVCGIDIDALAAAPDSVMIRSGVSNHGKLLYRMPFGLHLPSYQRWEKDDNGKKKAIFNFRCGTDEGRSVQDVLPPSIHPDTQQPYQWVGNGHWSQLPMIPQSLLAFWQEQLVDTTPVVVNGVDASWDEIRSALAHIDPDCSREDWIQAGMAIKWAGDKKNNPDQAFAIWDGWSAQGSKYKGSRETHTQWRSFRSDKTQVVMLGTLFKLAKEAGWVRPMPDASTLFGDVSMMVNPVDVMNTLKASPPEIDLGLFPPVLAKRAQEVSDTVGCDPIIPLWAGLAAVCGVVNAESRLELMEGFKVPPILWLMTLGDPGDKKTPGSSPMMDPIRDIEQMDRPRYAREFQTWQFKQAVYTKAHKAMMDYAASPEAIHGEPYPHTLPLEPPQPVPVKITVDDVTSQKLVAICQERPRGVLCYLDEMNSLVIKLTNRLSGENRSAWVRGFESKPYEMDRVHNGSTHCANFAVSIYGNMQPQVLNDNFSNLASDGFLQRFLPAVVDHKKARMGRPIPALETSAEQWENALRLAFSIDPFTYKLTPEAFHLYRDFQEWYEDRMQQERLIKSSNEFIMAFGKITGLVGRIAFIFHVLEDPWKPLVSGELMARVIRLTREYVIPAYRYTFDGEGSSSMFDSWVMEHIIQHADLESITLSDVKRSARRPFEKAGIKASWVQNEWVINAMYLLEKMQWVARVDDGTKEGNGQAKWLINPHLKTTFASYRESVVRAKLSRDEDRLEKAGLQRKPYVHGAEQL